MYKVVLIFLLLTTNHCFSQEKVGELGLRAGLNINDLGGKNAGYYSTLGFHVGAFYEAVINSHASIQPELIFSQQGAALDLNKDNRLNYYYLNIPVLAKIYFADDFTLQAGPQYGFLVAASNNTPIGNLNITENVRRHDFAIAFGVGYKYKGRTGLDIRYNLGISNTNFQEVVYSKRLTNRVLMFSLAYIL